MFSVGALFVVLHSTHLCVSRGASGFSLSRFFSCFSIFLSVSFRSFLGFALVFVPVLPRFYSGLLSVSIRFCCGYLSVLLGFARFCSVFLGFLTGRKPKRNQRENKRNVENSSGFLCLMWQTIYGILARGCCSPRTETRGGVHWFEISQMYRNRPFA